MKIFYSILFLSICITIPFYSQTKVDTIPASITDTALVNVEIQEQDFQSNLDSMFLFTTYNLDTFAWDNKMINSGRFDSKNWKDTARIVLVDSAVGKTYTHPFCNYITCNFGPRRALWHYGIDVKVLKGDTIRAILDGVIRVTKFDKRGYGHAIVIRHSGGLETIYGHLSKVLVEANQPVKAGTPIGLGGNTGRSTGSHLHFETRYYGEPFDPNHFIDFANCKIKSDTLVLSFKDFEYLIDLRRAKYHKVRKGETLGHIALRYGTTVTKICKLNHISRNSMIRIGQKIRYQ